VSDKEECENVDDGQIKDDVKHHRNYKLRSIHVHFKIITLYIPYPFESSYGIALNVDICSSVKQQHV